MPRPKTIAQGRIELSKILQEKHLDIVEKKDCFLVELVFNAPFTDEQWEIIENRFGFSSNRNACMLQRKINNSWKGLVMALLSLAYCKYGDKTIYEFIGTRDGKKDRKNDKVKIAKTIKNNMISKKGKNMTIHFYYEKLLDKETQLKVESEANQQGREIDINNISMDEFRKIIKQSQEERIEENKQHTKKVMTELIAQLPPDNRIEEVAGPKDWRSLYVRARYESADIQGYIALLGKMLDLNFENSFVETDYSKQLPHTYSVKAATPKYCGWYS